LVASAAQDRYILAAGPAGNRNGSVTGKVSERVTEDFMRAEIQKLVEDIKQSVGLLRRHL